MALEKWEIDKAHSSIGFTVRHMVVSKVRGEFRAFDATLGIDDANPGASSVELTIDAASINTHEEKRDAHLRSADFFDVERFPHIVFKSRRIEPAGGQKLRVTGDLAMHGVTREVVLDVEYAGRAMDPWGNEKAGVSVHTSIDRRDYGLTYNAVLEAGGVVISEKVEIAVELEVATGGKAKKA